MTPGIGGASTCPRCGGAFRCGVADAAPCPCTTVALDADATARLRAAHVGCLCPSCLREVAAGAAVAPTSARAADDAAGSTTGTAAGRGVGPAPRDGGPVRSR